MTEDKKLTLQQRQDLLLFLTDVYEERTFDELDDVLDNELPDKVSELSFIHNDFRRPLNTPYTLTDEFVQQVEYIRDYERNNIHRYPGAVSSYISSPKLSEEAKTQIEFRDSKIVTRHIVSDETYTEMMEDLRERFDSLEKEVDKSEINEDCKNAIYLLISIGKYSLREENRTQFANCIRPLYSFTQKNIDREDINRLYYNLGNRISDNFDMKNGEIENVYKFYPKGMMVFSNTVTQCLNVEQE